MSNDFDRSSGYVLPKPGIPKTLGILSIIFGVLTILYGTCLVGTTALSGAIMDGSANILKQAQQKVEIQQQASLKALDDQEKVATTDQEKASIQQQRDAIKATPKIDAQVATMDAAKDALKNPTLMGATYANLLTGLALSILLLVAGVNLVRLNPSGRKLGVAWGGLQIAQLFLVAALQFFVVMPANAPIQAKQMAILEDQAKQGNNPAATSALQMAKLTSGMIPVFVVGSIVLGSIYPIIMLILLNGAGARAALQGPKTSVMPELS